MRKLVVALSISTLLLAVSTVYLAHELRLARAPVPVGAAVAPQPGQPTSSAHPEVHAAAAITRTESGGDEDSPTTVTTTSDGQTHAMTREQARANAAQQAREFLKRIEDPERRRAYLEESKNQTRANYPGLAKYLGLDEVGFDRFLEVIASQELSLREKWSHCALEASCRFPGYDNSIAESMRLEAAALVGTETYRKFEAFRDSQGERQSVALLRGRLGDEDHMSDAQAESLALALADERRSMEMERANMVEGLTSFGSNGLSIYAGDGLEAMAAADALNRRMRDRAAQVLTAGQLAVFDQLRDDAMNRWRSFATMRATNEQAKRD